MSTAPAATAPKVDNEHHENIADKPPSEFTADVERHHLTLRGRKLTAALAFVAGTGFTLFGYVSLVRFQGYC